MALLIDGYNLLYASGFLGRRRGPGGLARARSALLNFLSATLSPAQVRRTTVVFDSRQAPVGGVSLATHRGIQVRFAVGFAEADDLIEVLIREDSAPRRLTVVSSDHRLQRAARRRRAVTVDSEDWLARLERRAWRKQNVAEVPETPRDRVLSEGEIQAWLKHFGADVDEVTEDSEAADKPAETDCGPFPPDYGDDLVAED